MEQPPRTKHSRRRHDFLQDDESNQQFIMGTGTVCSVLPHRSKTSPTGPQLSGANRKAIPCWGSVRRCLTFGLRTFFVTFLLAAVYRSLLGLEFLSAHGLLVDPVGCQVMNSKSLKLLSKPTTAAGTLRSKFAAFCSIAPTVRSLLASFAAIVGDRKGKPSPKHNIRHTIETTGRSVFANTRRLDLDKLRHAEAKFRELEAAGIIRHSSQTFQCFMDSLFKDLPFVFCYLDDLIIASHTLEEHHEHLRQIFTILKENGLQINPVKCVFAAAAMEFLGHRVDQHSVRPLQRHIQAISSPSGCETITTVFRYSESFTDVSFQVSPAHSSRSQMHSEGPPRRWSGRLPTPTPSERPRPPWRLRYTGSPRPEQCALPSNRRFRHTRRRRASTAQRGELAAAGVLLQEAVGGGHQVLHLRQGAAGRLQRGQTFQIPAGRATVSPPH
jgi:hypothetical protein